MTQTTGQPRYVEYMAYVEVIIHSRAFPLYCFVFSYPLVKICLGCSKGPSQWVASLEGAQKSHLTEMVLWSSYHIFWVEKEKNTHSYLEALRTTDNWKWKLWFQGLSKRDMTLYMWRYIGVYIWMSTPLNWYQHRWYDSYSWVEL